MTSRLEDRMLANRRVLAEMKAIEARTAGHAEEVAADAQQLAHHAERLAQQATEMDAHFQNLRSLILRAEAALSFLHRPGLWLYAFVGGLLGAGLAILIALAAFVRAFAR